MSTVREIVTGALRLINVVQANETPGDDDMNIALSAFDQMLDSWSNDRLLVYSINPYLFNTVGGQASYLMGPGSPVLTFSTIVPGSAYTNGSYTNVPLTGGSGSGATASITVAGGAVTICNVSNTQVAGGTGYKIGDVLSASNTNLGGSGSGFTVPVLTVGPGDWNIVRPLRIEQAYVVWNNNAQAVDLPVSLLTDAQFAAIAVKNTPSSFPFALFDNGNYPLKTVTVWPVPSVGTPLRLWLREPLVNFSALDAQVSYPPGYIRAFRFCLAVELAAEFGKTIPPEVMGTAIKAKEEIASMNAVPQYMSGAGGLNRAKSGWNWITGGFVPFGPR